MRASRQVVVVATALLAVACHVPRRAQPLHLSATQLDGGSFSAESLRGRPYVISLWLPG